MVDFLRELQQHDLGLGYGVNERTDSAPEHAEYEWRINPYGAEESLRIVALENVHGLFGVL